MRYFFIALLVLSAVVALSPSLRENVLAAVGSTLDKRRTQQANTRMTEIVALLRSRDRRLPSDDEFKAFVDRGLQNHPNDGTDPWGTPYYLRRDRFQYWVGSAGPDKLVRTGDDIVSRSTPLPANRYRGVRR
jgi:hypothetical protein